MREGRKEGKECGERIKERERANMSKAGMD
jgi:hypothetical protein